MGFDAKKRIMNQQLSAIVSTLPPIIYISTLPPIISTKFPDTQFMPWQMEMMHQILVKV